ncbi:hypothetical protein KAR34_03650 [bacterium]|nr:hypothetical protein [bacterium]
MEQKVEITGDSNVVIQSKNSEILINTKKTKGNQHIKRSWIFPLPIKLSILGMLGMISSIITIISFLLNLKNLLELDQHLNPILSYLSIIFIILASFSLVLWIELRRKKFLRVGSFFNLEISKRGMMIISGLSGKCQKCNNQLLFSNKNNKMIAECERNPNHRFEFDPTDLEEL